MAHADLDPTNGGLVLESDSGLAILWTFSQDRDVSARGVTEWKPEDYSSQHTDAVDVVLNASSYVGARVQPKWSWEILLSTEDYSMLESVACRGWSVGLNLARGIFVTTPAGESVEWSFISEVAILNTLTEDILDSHIRLETAFQALLAMEREDTDEE